MRLTQYCLQGNATRHGTPRILTDSRRLLLCPWQRGRRRACRAAKAPAAASDRRGLSHQPPCRCFLQISPHILHALAGVVRTPGALPAERAAAENGVRARTWGGPLMCAQTQYRTELTGGCINGPHRPDARVHPHHREMAKIRKILDEKYVDII